MSLFRDPPQKVNRALNCKLCDFVAGSSSTYYKHVRKAHLDDSENALECNHCDFRSLNEIGLNVHMRTKHSMITAAGETPVEAPVEAPVKAPKRRRTTTDIPTAVEPPVITQEQNEENKKDFLACEHCEFRTKYRQALKQHLEKKHGVSLPRVNRRKSVSVETSSGEKSFRCVECDFEVGSYGKLQTHFRNSHGNGNNNKNPAERKRLRRRNCGKCAACLSEDCGKCAACLDKPKFGGSGVQKQRCRLRKCHGNDEVDEVVVANEDEEEVGVELEIADDENREADEDINDISDEDEIKTEAVDDDAEVDLQESDFENNEVTNDDDDVETDDNNNDQEDEEEAKEFGYPDVKVAPTMNKPAPVRDYTRKIAKEEEMHFKYLKPVLKVFAVAGSGSGGDAGCGRPEPITKFDWDRLELKLFAMSQTKLELGQVRPDEVDCEEALFDFVGRSGKIVCGSKLSLDWWKSNVGHVDLDDGRKFRAFEIRGSDDELIKTKLPYSLGSISAESMIKQLVLMNPEMPPAEITAEDKTDLCVTLRVSKDFTRFLKTEDYTLKFGLHKLRFERIGNII